MEITSLSEAEIQALIMDIELSDPAETPNNNHYSFYPKNRREAQKYFCTYAVDIPNHRHAGITHLFDDKGFLTVKGRDTAREVRFLRPPIYYWYRMYYAAIEDSVAFAAFNREVFGIDVDQFGFCSLRQIDKIIELLGVHRDSVCLDIGCGNGKIAEYVHSVTEASMVGIDYVPEAIESARRRVDSQSLSFQIMQIDDLLSAKSTFDAIMSIDTIFYGRSYERMFSDIRTMLKDSGVLVFVTSEDMDMECALEKFFQYEKYDYTDECFRTMKRKNRIMKKLKDDFAKESKSFIWKQYMAESIDESVPDGFSRFIYRASPI